MTLTFQVPDLESRVGVASDNELASACNANVDDLRWMLLSTTSPQNMPDEKRVQRDANTARWL